MPNFPLEEKSYFVKHLNIQSKGRLKRGLAVKKEEEKEKVPFISSSVD